MFKKTDQFSDSEYCHTTNVFPVNGLLVKCEYHLITVYINESAKSNESRVLYLTTLFLIDCMESFLSIICLIVSSMTMSCLNVYIYFTHENL